MTVLRPEWLLLLPLIALWLYHSLKSHTDTGGWRSLFDRELLAPLLQDREPRRQWLERLRWGSLLLLPIALSGPAITDDNQGGQPLSPVMIVLSQSPTMRHDDLPPTRYQRALRVAEQWLNANPGRPVGLIAYSGSAHLIAPPTVDHNTLRLMLSQLSPDIMPVAGRASGQALRLAIERAGLINADILWLTDQVGDAEAQSLPALPAGTRLHALVTASADAQGPVRDRDGTVLRDASGQALLAAPDADRFRALLQAQSGDWQWLTDRTPPVSQLMPPRGQLTDADEEPVSGWRDLGPYLFLALLPGLLLQIPVAGVSAGLLVLLSGALAPMTADAAGTWWQNADQRALERLDESPVDAAEMFTDRRWQTYAWLVAERPQQAIERLGDDTSAWGAYHRGLALARLGRYDQALSAFETAVRERPDWQPAVNNRDLLREWLHNRSDSPTDTGQQSDRNRQDPRTQTGQPTVPEANSGTPAPGAGAADRERDQRAEQRLPPPDRSFMERKLRFQWEQQRAQ